MSGPTRVLLDTNAVIALLRGNPEVQQHLAAATWVGISIITLLEFRSFGQMTQTDRDLFDAFCRRSEVIGLAPENGTLLDRIVEVRRDGQLKLPDAIVVGTSLALGCAVISADAKLARVRDLTVLRFQP